MDEQRQNIEFKHSVLKQEQRIILYVEHLRASHWRYGTNSTTLELYQTLN